MNETCPILWRIALSEAKLARNYFFNFKIPSPTAAQFKDHAAIVSQSDGGAQGHGYNSVVITWAVLRPYQAYYIKAFIDGANGGTGLLYLTIPINDAEAMGRRWIDVSGRARYPDFQEMPDMVGSVGMAYQNVTLTVNNLTIINNPALF